MTVQLPAARGVYRLVTTVHGPDGVAFDATTQALIPALSVRVSSALSAAYGVMPTLSVVAGAAVALPVRVANDGAERWGVRPSAADLSEELVDPSVARAHPRARLVGRWVPLAIDGVDAPALPEASISAQPEPGTEMTVVLDAHRADRVRPVPARPRCDEPAPRVARGERCGHRAGPGHRPAGVRNGGQSRGALIRRPRREIAPVASAATPIAMSLRSAGGRARTADRN